MSDLEYIREIISQGEGEHLDFKEKIEDPFKIATTIASFANHKGGRLLVGVKDQGGIRGINPEEERFMLERASREMINPEIVLSYSVMGSKKKKVLIVDVPDSDAKPHAAKTAEGKWKYWLRFADNTIKASKVSINILKRKSGDDPSLIKFGPAEKWILEKLQQTEAISLRQFAEGASIPKWLAEKILVNLVSADLLHINYSMEGDLFTLVKEHA